MYSEDAEKVGQGETGPDEGSGHDGHDAKRQGDEPARRAVCSELPRCTVFT